MSDKRIAFVLLSSLLVALSLGAALAGADDQNGRFTKPINSISADAEQMGVPAEGYRVDEVDSCDGVDIGNADGSTQIPTIDIDDVVYLITYIFISGSPPTPYPVASGDANCDCMVDIDNIVYLLFAGWGGKLRLGPPPPTCEEWIEICGSLH